MIVKIEIEDANNGEKAILQYDDDPTQQLVTWGVIGGSQDLIDKLQNYFNEESEFKMPTDAETDQFEIQKAVPTSNVGFFELAMCEMFQNTRVKLLKDVSNFAQPKE